MSEYTATKYGHLAMYDTGAPEGSDNYKTVVVVPGLEWHAGVFTKLLPLAEKQGSRVVIMQRRDYPGADPLNEKELALLSSTSPATPKAAANIKLYMKQRAEEFYHFLEKFVIDEDIPVEGGFVLVGWSFGAVWITALLAHAASFGVNDVELDKYIRRVFIYDAPIPTLGFGYPADLYNPLSDPSHSPSEGVRLFLSGYYQHGESTDKLEKRTALSEPRPSILGMSPEEQAKAIYSPPAMPGGSDSVLMGSGIKHQLFKSLKEQALYLKGRKSDWDNIELRYLWCEQSVWEMPFTAWTLQAELKEAEKSGKRTRKVTWMKLKGANHFAHWDMAERTLCAYLSDEVDESQ